MMSPRSKFEPKTVALLGLGEAGSAIAQGLCGTGGWRAAETGRQVIAIDIALGEVVTQLTLVVRPLEQLAEPEVEFAFRKVEVDVG